ncbi:hypothetical protein SAMN02927921_01154 [Sinomicrobium oceani]|uniref:Neuroendocrine-specific golgi protein P55 (NESP55) n=1 Tax=Sinomicrobium oceani TaxID=1150368 RepID=A0A1K1NDF6_9FLAO|nr:MULTISPECIES: BfmA/BtgA family mobilization protein [Flavobacteriaceae]SFW33281.1 hypothetical protein SAMN02927921_01154 [Sinomicrobium oceani]
MDKGYEKERFEKLGIKTSVAKKFRKFCRKMSCSQSMGLLLMIDFFEEHGISPKESLGPNMQTLESKIKKRINAVIAIMRDVEKTQTKPTVAMLQSLFEVDEPKKKPLILEKKYAGDKQKEPKFREKKSTNDKP